MFGVQDSFRTFFWAFSVSFGAFSGFLQGFCKSFFRSSGNVWLEGRLKPQSGHKQCLSHKGLLGCTLHRLGIALGPRTGFRASGLQGFRASGLQKTHFHPNSKKKLIQRHFRPETLSSKNGFRLTLWVNLAHTCVKPLVRLYVCQRCVAFFMTRFGSIF